MEPEPETVKVYSSYTEAQKRATKKYREQNKEKVNAQRKKYYDERKSKDPNFLSYKREKAKEYYIKKKGVKEDEEGCEEVKEEGEDLSHLIPQLVEAIKILDTKEDDVTTEESKTPPITEPKTPRAPRKSRLKKEQNMKENIKPEDLKELEAELLKVLDVVDIIHGEPMVPQVIPDTIEEHFEKKAKKPRVKRTIAKEE
jgi:hypothetical protein